MSTPIFTIKEKAGISCIGVLTLYISYFSLIMLSKSSLLSILCISLGSAMSLTLLIVLTKLAYRKQRS